MAITFCLRHSRKDRRPIRPIRPGTARSPGLRHRAEVLLRRQLLIKKPVVPSPNGTSTTAYVPPPSEPPLSVNGELHKLAHNISYGHGIHAGIHWRSDTETSIQLGEAVALSYLQDRADTYNERFSVSSTKLDGSIATISDL